MKPNSFLRRFLLTVLVTLCLTAGAAAAEPSMISVRLPMNQDGYLPLPVSAEVSLQDQTLEERLYERLYQGFLNHEYPIDISDFELPSSSNAVTQAIFTIVTSHPELTYFSGGFMITFDSHTDLILAVYPSYSDMEPEQPPEDRTEELLDEILALIDNSWTDLEKLMFINDYLTSNYEYDESFEIYDIENFLT